MSIVVICERGAKDKEAPDISDNLITTESLAVSRGKRFLDDPNLGAYYLTKKRSFRSMHKNNGVIPGSWISVYEPSLGLENTLLRVTAVNIQITPNGLWENIDTEQYCEPSTN